MTQGNDTRRLLLVAGCALVAGVAVAVGAVVVVRGRAAPAAAAPAPAGARPPAAAPEAAPPAPPRFGANVPHTLVIMSEPFGADITVNGQATGLRTPESIDGLAPGRSYKVRLTRKGFAPWEQDIFIAAGGKSVVSAKLGKRGR
jgi:hypothetical protein